MTASTARRWLSWLPATLLVVAGAAILWAQLWGQTAPADPGDWEPAARHVGQKIDEDDGILVHPDWNLDGLPYLSDLGDQVVRQRRPVAGDLQGIETLWILSETPRLSGLGDRLPFPVDNPDVTRFGPISVARIPVPQRLQADWEALHALPDAEVRKETASGFVPCTMWNSAERRWDCQSRDRWIYVGEVLKPLGDDIHRAIWMHPPGDNNAMQITFPDVDLTDWMTVRAGLTFMGSRFDGGTDVTLEIAIDGEAVDSATFAGETTTWRPIEVATDDYTSPADVTFTVRSANVRDRFFCLNAWVWPPGSPPPTRTVSDGPVE
jgi:hypothetical protein